MAAQGYGSVVRMTAATVLVWAIFALPFMSSAMPPPDTETTTTEHQDVLHLYPELLEGLDYSDKQGTVKSVHDVPEAEVPEEALVISEKQALSEAELRRREVIFRNLLTAAIQKDKSLAALMLRYVFHDAYTVDPTTKKGGCNGSIRQELDRIANTGLDKAVALLTPMQKHSGLGWGDVSAVAGAVAVEVTGGPKIVLKLGRRESNDQDPVGILPSPRENIRNLQASFKSRGFSDLDLASLSGGHTLGKGFGVPFVSHPNKFANDYFINLAWFLTRRREGKSTAGGPPDKPNRQFPSDMALLEDDTMKNIVLMFSMSEASFFHCFKGAYLKLVNSGESF